MHVCVSIRTPVHCTNTGRRNGYKGLSSHPHRLPGRWRLANKLNYFHDSASVPGPWVFCFVPPPGVCVLPVPPSGQPIPNSTINARGAHPLDPLPNITPSNLFCFFSPSPSLFIVPAKPCLSLDNGCHHPTRETRIPRTHHTRPRTRAHTAQRTCSCLWPGTQCPRSRPRETKQSGRGSCHLELNPAEPHNGATERE